MMVRIMLKTKHGDACAEAIYSGKTTTVLPGGKISSNFADHIKCGNKERKYRENIEFVDVNRNIVKECIFTSPSAAAQFVTGRSANGYLAWKVEKKKTLGKYLKENGLK